MFVLSMVDRLVRLLYAALAKLPTEAVKNENHDWVVKTKAAWGGGLWSGVDSAASAE